MYFPVFVANQKKDVVGIFNNNYFSAKKKFLLPWVNPCQTQGIFYNVAWFKQNLYPLKFGPYCDFYHTRKHRIFSHCVFLLRPSSVFIADGISSQENISNIAYRFKVVFAICRLYRCKFFFMSISVLYLFLSLFYRLLKNPKKRIKIV